MGRPRQEVTNIRPIGDDPWAQTYIDHGMNPPWLRVWRDGVDITDAVPPEEWPWPWSMYYAAGQRPYGWKN